MRTSGAPSCARSGLPAPLRRVAPARGRRARARRPGPGRAARPRPRGRPVPLRPVGHRRLAPALMPMVLGHEAAGEVVRPVGPGVGGFAAGDHVVLAFVPALRGLRALPRRPRPRSASPGRAANAAGELLGGGRRLRTADGVPLHHHLGVSAFAEHAVVSARSAVRVDPELPFELAALFGCAVLTGVGRRDPRRPRSRPATASRSSGSAGSGSAAVLGAVVAGRGDDRRDRRRAREARAGARAGGDARGRRGPRRRRRASASSPAAAPTTADRDRRQRARPGRGLRRHAPRRHDGHRRPAGPEPDARRSRP